MCIMEITNAVELYELLLQYATQQQTTICQLHNAEPHTPCPQSKYFCQKESVKKVVDFDAVKVKYCKCENINPTWQSVDAVMPKEEIFLFVEIKSWRNFDKYQMTNIHTKEEKEQIIEKQVKEFKLKQKIERSIEICQNISKNKYLFDKIPMIYVLVTDIDTVTNPMLRLRVQLGVLAYKSVNISLYTSASTNELSTLAMNVRYTSCYEFDNLCDSL